MQYSQEPPNMLLVGGSAIFEKIILAHRFDRFISMLLRRIAPLLMLLVLALHYLAWRFLAAVRPEYGGAVIGLAVLALVIYGFHLTGHGTPVKRGLELALRVVYALAACYLAFEYSDRDYMPAINYLQHLKVRRHLFAPLLASVLIGAFGLLITAPLWGESKFRVYALVMALAACWIAYATNVNSTLVINTRPVVATELKLATVRHKSADSVLSAHDIQALSTVDTAAALNHRVRSRINAERNWCVLGGLVGFCLCLVSVWTLRTWLETHGVRSRQDFSGILQYLQDHPRPNN